MVKNQTYLRYRNKESIIKILRAQSCSYSDIARELKLSNTAVSKIVDDLISENIVLRMEETKGRHGINLCINPEIGYVIGLDLSSADIKIMFVDLAGNVLLKKVLCRIDTFFKWHFIEMILSIKEITQSEMFKDKALRCISIASPGKIDSKTGKFVLNPRFVESENISLKELFSAEFECEILVNNDINMALSGEMTYGSILKKKKNAIMLHVDIGTGAAFMFDGKLYVGSRGYAGEIGFFNLNLCITDEMNFSNISYHNYYDAISLFSILSLIKNELIKGKRSIICEWCKEEGITIEQITIQTIIRAYKSEDSLTVKYINSIAQIIGNMAKNLTELLDVEVILLNGGVIEFGLPFLKEVSHYLKNIKVCYSDLKEDATIMGSIDVGIKEAFIGLINVK